MSLEPEDLARAFLEFAKGDDAGRKFPLAAATTTFGRVSGNSHVVADTTISRQHAKIFVRDGRHWIADQNSTHGTFVNGQKITLQTLADGDEVRFGTTLLHYRSPAAPRTAPPAAAAPRTPPPVLAEPPTGSFDLELPAAGAPPKRPTMPAPPPAPRRGLTETGEDPFALEAPPDPAAPTIELRGATARAAGIRSSNAPVSAASPRSITTHLPPPIANAPRRSGAFAFLRDDLDQRGGIARFAAIVFALAIAGALGWLALRAFDLLPNSAESADDPDAAPTGPQRPTLPERR